MTTAATAGTRQQSSRGARRLLVVAVPPDPYLRTRHTCNLDRHAPAELRAIADEPTRGAVAERADGSPRQDAGGVAMVAAAAT